MAYVFSVPDMSCGHCRARIEKAFTEWGKAAAFTVDLETKQVRVESDETPEIVQRIIEDVGYTPKLI